MCSQFFMVSDGQESQYLDLARRIISSGQVRKDRTGTGTVSLFAPPQLRFDLSTFPLLTTKRMYLRPIFEELMWFIRGQTNAKILQSKKVHIWDGNGSKEFLEKRGLPYDEGDLGPIYGFQWRHFGAEYIDSETDYSGKGVDQLLTVFKSLLYNPTDRRIILSAWNPAALSKMALPPCHIFCQFYVEGNKLSCQLYQRSCDVGLGVPFNIASYSLLTLLIAHLCGMQGGEFIHVMGDTHIYLDHIEPLKPQLERRPFSFPSLRILKASPLEDLKANNASPDEIVEALVRELESFEFTDIVLDGYQSHGKIEMKMSA